MVNTLLIDNQKLISDCLSLVFREKEQGIHIIIADSIEVAQIELKKQNIDVILLDIDIINDSNAGFIDHFKKEFPKIKVIAITETKDKWILYKIWMKGVDAILSKNCGINLFIDTIKQVYKGQRIISKYIPDFFNYLSVLKTKKKPCLSKREEEVLSLLSTGLTRREVANNLFVSVETINFHCKNLLKKFEMNRMRLLISKAREMNLIS